ncbi:MAG: metal ABC transporter permease, partial [Bdellovibrionales bacterium]|nr:metal ABC transporter permease [Bdellovibrionales bacterium]
ESITDVGWSWPTLDKLVEVLTLQSGFNSAVVILGATFLGCASGIVGTFALLRKRALMADALSHSALPGLCLSFIFAWTLGFDGKSLPILLLGATVSGIVGVLSVQFLVQHTRLNEDAAIGSVLSVFFGFGILLLSLIQSLGTGSEGGLNHFIYGQTAAMGASDAIFTLAVTISILIMTLLLLKEFRLVCFDQDYAATLGWPVATIDLIMMSSVVVVTVTGLETVGMLLIVSLIIIPPVTARFWTENLTQMTVISGSLGALSCYIGAALSAVLPRFPAGSVIVLTSGIFFAISFLLAPRRGLLASFVRGLMLRLEIAADHVLRLAYEHAESTDPLEVNSIDVIKNCASLKSWNRFFRFFVFVFMMLRRLLKVSALGSLTLTQRGSAEAVKITRNHRLWEEYMLLKTDIPLSHVDYSADFVEHALSSEIIERLESGLQESGRLPKSSPPASAHPFDEG